MPFGYASAQTLMKLRWIILAIVDKLKNYYKLLPVQLMIVNQRAAQIAGEIYNAAIQNNTFADNEAFNPTYGEKLQKYILYYDIGKCELPCSRIRINRMATDDEIAANRKAMTILEDTFRDAKLTEEDQICKEIMYHAIQKNEQYDGMGFPNCLKGPAISPIGRILCVADYVARKFIDCLDKDELIKKLKQKIGKRFDPDVVVLAVGVIEDLYRREKAALPEPTDEFRSIRMLYQPVMDAPSKVTKQNVAFIGLNDPKVGTVMPSFYLPVAAKNGRIMDITKFGLEFLFQDMAASKFAPQEFARTFSIQISTECLSKAPFLTYVKKLIRDFAVNPQRLIIEVNASALDVQDTKLVENLRCFKELGFKLALDNYGLDEGSLYKLQELEFDIIKIDRSFIDKICDNQKTYEIVKNIVKMARDLKIEVIAKGVDSEQQKEFLLGLKCFYMQGRLFGEPDYLS